MTSEIEKKIKLKKKKKRRGPYYRLEKGREGAQDQTDRKGAAALGRSLTTRSGGLFDSRFEQIIEDEVLNNG